MEMEILTEAEATAKPAGIARDDPNQHPTLEPPKYSAASSSSPLLQSTLSQLPITDKCCYSSV